MWGMDRAAIVEAVTQELERRFPDPKELARVMAAGVREYDPKICITAGELRERMAMNIPEDVPDCAWVPRIAVYMGAFDVVPVKQETDGNGMVDTTANVQIHIRTQIEILAPFQWFTATLIEDPAPSR